MQRASQLACRMSLTHQAHSQPRVPAPACSGGPVLSTQVDPEAARRVSVCVLAASTTAAVYHEACPFRTSLRLPSFRPFISGAGLATGSRARVSPHTALPPPPQPPHSCTPSGPTPQTASLKPPAANRLPPTACRQPPASYLLPRTLAVASTKPAAKAATPAPLCSASALPHSTPPPHTSCPLRVLPHTSHAATATPPLPPHASCSFSGRVLRRSHSSSSGWSCV